MSIAKRRNALYAALFHVGASIALMSTPLRAQDAQTPEPAKPVVEMPAPATPAPILQAPAPTPIDVPVPAAAQDPAPAANPAGTPAKSNPPAAAPGEPKSAIKTGGAADSRKSQAPVRRGSSSLVRSAPPAAETLAPAPEVVESDANAAPPPAAPPAPASLTPAQALHPEAPSRVGDWVPPAILIVLLLLALGGTHIVAAKAREQTAVLEDARLTRQTFWSAPTLHDGIQRVPESSPFRYIGESAIRASEHRSANMEKLANQRTWVMLVLQRSVDYVRSRLGNDLGLLAAIGIAAPVLGLFGAAWAMTFALAQSDATGLAPMIGAAGSMGIAMALIVLGLAIAVSVAVGRNRLGERNRLVMVQIDAFASDLKARLRGDAEAAEMRMRADAAAEMPSLLLRTKTA